MSLLSKPTVELISSAFWQQPHLPSFQLKKTKKKKKKDGLLTINTQTSYVMK